MPKLTNVYFIRCRDFVKIGKGNDPDVRLREFQCGNPYEMEIIGSYAATPAEEHRLHLAFEQFHHKNEWFYLSRVLQDFIASAGGAKLCVASESATSIFMQADREHVDSYIQSRNRVETIRPAVLYSAYSLWCGGQGLHPITLKRFGIAMVGLGIAKERRGNRVTYFNVREPGRASALCRARPRNADTAANDNNVAQHALALLRKIDTKLDRVADDVSELKKCVGRVEKTVAELRVTLAWLSILSGWTRSTSASTASRMVNAPT